jgi:Cu-Zn family superoxide dismutase
MKTHRFIIFIAALSAAGFMSARAQDVTKAVAELHPLKDSKVEGKVTFTKESGGIRVVAEVRGLTPGLHGFHVHEKGDCSDPEGKSAGGHFNPTNEPHAGPDSEHRHAGDLGNLTADAGGNAKLDLVDKHLALDGANSILNLSVIVHAKADDLKSQPAGESGERIACGVIKAE